MGKEIGDKRIKKFIKIRKNMFDKNVIKKPKVKFKIKKLKKIPEIKKTKRMTQIEQESILLS